MKQRLLQRSVILLAGMAAMGLLCQAAQPAGDRAARVNTLQQAAQFIEAQEFPRAEALLRALLDKSPGDPLALNLLGVVRAGQQNPVQAEDLFRRAAEKGPHLAGPHVNLALLYGKARAEDAIRELGKALELAPGDDQAQSALRAIAKAAAAEAARSGDKERALALLLRARQTMPRDPEILVETALAAMELGLYADAEKDLLDSLRLRPDFPRATYALARAYLAESKTQQAEEQMRKYLAARPDDATAHYGLGYILLTEQKVGQARAAFERSLALEPRQTESLFQLGEISLQEDHRDEAAARFEQVLVRDPKHAGALTETGVLAFRAGNLAGARRSLEQAVAIAPSYQKAHYYYALTLKKLGNDADAAREFRISTDLQKHDAPVARLAADHE